MERRIIIQLESLECSVSMQPLIRCSFPGKFMAFIWLEVRLLKGASVRPIVDVCF